MEHSLEREIRERLADYLADQSSLDDFKVWLAKATWDATSAEPYAVRLANEIKLVLAEHSGAFIEIAEVRSGFLDLLQHSEVVLAAEAQPKARSDSSSETVTQRLTFPQSSVGTTHAWVSVS